jgi:uncharacterized protein YhdP
MSEIKTSSGIEQVHGKTNGRDSGYFYMRNGKQFYRTRDETYQKDQSPRQKWNSAAFKHANSQLKLLATPEAKAQMLADFEAARHIASNGKTYSTARAWKFNSLIHEYKQTHPFES